MDDRIVLIWNDNEYVKKMSAKDIEKRLRR